jgi:hypothetical protein
MKPQHSYRVSTHCGYATQKTKKPAIPKKELKYFNIFYLLYEFFATTTVVKMASKPTKRKLELEEVDSLEEPVSTASLHAVVSSLSPVKKGRNSDYFEGTVTDGKSTVRLVGFKRSQQSKIQRFMDKQQPILLDDCEINTAGRGPRMEITLKVSTAITSSPKKILNRFCVFGRTTYCFI